MTVTRHGLARRVCGSVGWRLTRWGVLLATLVGLVVMHQLAGAPDLGSAAHATVQQEAAGHGPMTAVPPAGDGHCGRPDGECPDGNGDDNRHGHAGQVCQFTAPASSTGPVLLLTAVPGVPPTVQSAVSPRTAMQQAAGGSGCGPPTLSELSVFRI
ncbi:hypothetical protein GCM10027290_21570 [Micromonospora sonneratiae]|uniref:DUF6153 family protein n=1 Tax=Micromonospora sonneratiae TaxID=1184706 RepID=A0ABW3YHD5_9ACTN